MAIGTTAAILGGAAIAGGVAQGVLGNKAAKTQAGAARDAAGLQADMFYQSRADAQPAINTGNTARSALAFELGLGARPERVFRRDDGRWTFSGSMGSFETPEEAQAQLKNLGEEFSRYQGFEASPGYNFLREEGTRAVDASAASRGGLFSGATMKAQERFGQGIAAQEYNNYLNRLSALSGSGQVAQQNVSALGAQSAANQGNALMQGGQARASGYNAIGNSITGTINNGLGIAAYGGWFDKPAAGITGSGGAP